jgi:hypothetical protein
MIRSFFLEDAPMTLVPAYGRDYKSKKEIQADFDADKDFEAVSVDCSGGYVNKSNLKTMGIKEVVIRYKRNTQVTVIKVK